EAESRANAAFYDSSPGSSERLHDMNEAAAAARAAAEAVAARNTAHADYIDQIAAARAADDAARAADPNATPHAAMDVQRAWEERAKALQAAVDATREAAKTRWKLDP